MIIKYFAWIKNITEIDEELIFDKSVVDIESLKKYIIKKHPKLKKFLLEDNTIRVAINLEYIIGNKSLNKNDEIALFPPVSGG